MTDAHATKNERRLKRTRKEEGANYTGNIFFRAVYIKTFDGKSSVACV